MARIIMDLDRDWRFHLGEVKEEAQNSHNHSYSSCKAGGQTGPGAKIWKDDGWRVVNLPHDYFSESDFSESNLHSHGYRTRCNAWYRKSFILEPSLADRDLFICFEGTAVNAEFYFNGSLIARSFSAYTETVFNITDRAYFDGRPNILAVYIKGLETEGWWYEGAGIYRHVRLYAKDRIHIAHNGIFAKTVFKGNRRTKNWIIDIEATLENGMYEDSAASIRARLYDGETVISDITSPIHQLPYDRQKTVKLKLPVSHVRRWDVDSPNLYTLKIDVIRDGAVVDSEDTRIGFRTFSIDPDKGFFLNGRPLKIKGTCNHQDHAGVGVAIPDSLQYYRIKRLKEMGTNAYRASHNLPAKEVLDACDELGLIVMDENRRFETRDEVLEYLDIMVKRDRNHPSVIFWSLFNEEPLQNTEEGARIFRRMKSRVLQLDDTRLITGAINGNMEGAGLEMDVTGMNYGIGAIDKYHAQYPNQPIIGSENNSAVTTRGCYKSDYENAQVLSNYDEEKVAWGQTIRETWKFTRERDYFAGIFIWTGFDYRGEPSPFKWPSVSSQFGIMDTCGFPKDSFYFNRACFVDEPMVHLLPHWNHNEGDTVRVMAVSNCKSVELILNGVSIGRKPCDPCDPAEWQLPFEAGTLTAKAYKTLNGSEVIATDSVTTAGSPHTVKLMPVSRSIKNDGADTAIINVELVDKNGVRVPCDDRLIHFDIIGDGYLRGVGNGDPNSHELDVIPQRTTFCGLCQLLVTSKLGGKKLSIRAYGDGLEDTTLQLDVAKAAPPICPSAIDNHQLDGFTMSPVTDERPDPCMAIDDDDMNSFIPVTFDASTSIRQRDFRNGYRIYRVTPTALKTGRHALNFVYFRFTDAEIYVNGKLIDRIDHLNKGPYITKQFDAKEGERLDIRLLLHAVNDNEFGAGIANRVELFATD